MQSCNVCVRPAQVTSLSKALNLHLSLSGLSQVPGRILCLVITIYLPFVPPSSFYVLFTFYLFVHYLQNFCFIFIYLKKVFKDNLKQTTFQYSVLQARCARASTVVNRPEITDSELRERREREWSNDMTPARHLM